MKPRALTGIASGGLARLRLRGGAGRVCSGLRLFNEKSLHDTLGGPIRSVTASGFPAGLDKAGSLAVAKRQPALDESAPPER